MVISLVGVENGNIAVGVENGNIAGWCREW